MNRLQSMLANPHTTGAGALYLIGKYGSRLALVWFPHFHDQIAATADVLEGAAVAWGFVMAGDAKGLPAQPPQQQPGQQAIEPKIP